MRALVFGGTFNPVHIGHLFIAEEARLSCGFDAVIFVPSNIPVHKPTDEIIESTHRLAMLRLAVEGNPAFIVDDCELRRGGRSYMIDTIGYLAKTYPLGGKPGLLVGDDLSAGFHLWKEAERLSDITEIVLARRTGSPVPFPYPHREIDNPFIPVSSSDIRARIREGRTFRYLVPETVFGYVGEHALFGR